MQKALSESVCLCVYGTLACTGDWLAAVRAQLPADTGLILIGASAVAIGYADALRFADLDADAPARLLELLAEPLRGRHALIVRADAELPPFAFARLLRALEQPDVLGACAMDGLDPARCPLPDEARRSVPAQRIDALCHAYSQRRLVDVETLSPLASAWHADASDARRTRTVLLDHLYVGSASPAQTTAPTPADLRDPLPPSPLALLREQLAAALPDAPTPGYAGLDGKPVLLHVLHGWGGGAERWVRDFCAAYTDAHHRVLVSRGSHARRRHGEWLEMHAGAMRGPPLRRVALPVAIQDTRISEGGYRDLLHELLREQSVDAVIVSSLIGHSLDVLRSGLPTVRIVHDHYPLWPVLHRDFGDPALAFADTQRGEDLAAQGSDREFTQADAGYWKALRDATVSALLDARALIVAPSRAALANDVRLAPELAVLARHIIPHGLSAWPIEPPSRRVVPLRARLRLVVPGRVRHGKGARLLDELLPLVAGFAEVFLLGAGSDAQRYFGIGGVHVVLDYARADLPALLARIAADAAVLLPTVSETFGYTLSELRDLGMPVVATRVGAFVERIDDGFDGFLVAPDASAIAARLRELAADRAALGRVRENLTTRREPDLAGMARAYAELLALHESRAARAPLLAIDLASQQVAERTEALRAQRTRIEALQAVLLVAQQESARRGDWGHALDRELAVAHTQRENVEADLADRTRWALQLNSELGALRPAHEIMLASRSWRLTAPLRSAAVHARDLRARLAFRKAHTASLLRRLRGSLARNGVGGTLARVLREVGARPPARLLKPVDAPTPDFAPFALPTSETPTVSIIIPVHNKFDYTAACLRSLAEHAGAVAFEVIVVDDSSTDSTPDRVAQIDGVRALRNERNLGFVGSCNAGAAIARGEFVLFLNNDTVVTPGWLEALFACFAERPDAGLVGAQLVYPDGRLQEAGGIVFSDGSGWNYGRFDDPDDPRYAYRREVDYCSGAAIMLRRALFESLGRFDLRYAPAYYEDTDLAFAVRAAGLKVYYEPRARVIHFEGITAGTDTGGSGMKRFQLINQEKFLGKWKDALARQPAAGTPIGQAATHRAKRRILIIDATTPTPDQDSGSLRMLNLMKVLLRNACHVVFMASNRAWVERYTSDLQALGVEVLLHPMSPDPVRLFRDRGAEFDAIVLSRHYVAAEYVGLARLYAKRARLVFDTVDLHYLREQRAAELEGRADLARQAAATRRHELKLMRECDITLVVSPIEQAILALDAPGVTVDVLSNVHEVYGCRAPFAARRDLVFIGSFQHPPNLDAVHWYVREVHPLVLARRPELKFHVIGSGVTDAVLALASDSVIVHGFVDDIAPYMDGCRLSLAPLRYGAGVKGKVNMAMSYGLPVVATTMAVEGMHVRTGEDVMVADDAPAFAAAILALYDDESAWNRLSRNGLANVREHFSFDAAETAIRRIIGF